MIQFVKSIGIIAFKSSNKPIGNLIAGDLGLHLDVLKLSVSKIKDQKNKRQPPKKSRLQQYTTLTHLAARLRVRCISSIWRRAIMERIGRFFCDGALHLVK